MLSNPYTPRGTYWTKYEMKVVPAESYMHQGKRIVHRWRVVVMKVEPGAKPVFFDYAFAPHEDRARQLAVDYAKKILNSEPRNPNDIRVYNAQGECFYSVQKAC
jgi:hypothetical protein